MQMTQMHACSKHDNIHSALKSLRSVIVYTIFGSAISGYAWHNVARFARAEKRPKTVHTQYRMESSEEIAQVNGCIEERFQYRPTLVRARVLVCDCCLSPYCDQLPPRPQQPLILPFAVSSPLQQ